MNCGDELFSDDTVFQAQREFLRTSMMRLKKSNILFSRVLEATPRVQETFQSNPFWDSCERVSSSQGVPDDERTMLHVNSLTEGVFSLSMRKSGRKFQLYEIGGVRFGRRRNFAGSLSCDYIVYFVPLSDWNVGLYENPCSNSFLESLTLFKNIVHPFLYKSVKLFLYFSKFDLFFQKYAIDGVPLPDFIGFRKPPIYDQEDDDDNTCAKARIWFQELYLGRLPASYRFPVPVVFGSNLAKDDVYRSVLPEVISYELILPP
eukprot:maker-scaffold_42-snap-gene-2.74-mRNA-1 protein AED:0.00 eAED:0.00 QI:446/1/1/1/0.33/0.25/4/22/260